MNYKTRSTRIFPAFLTCSLLLLAGCSTPATKPDTSKTAASSEHSTGFHPEESVLESQSAGEDVLVRADGSRESIQPADSSESLAVPDSDAEPSDSPAPGENAAGRRIPVSLEEAVLKKNHGESFVLLYVKDNCQYCAAFDEVLNPYLQEHALQIYEVNLSEAEAVYPKQERETMLDILSAGVSKTPALYYIYSQQQVYLLDHSETNYSKSGLEQWVKKYDLLKADDRK